jgi:hypothetical protein
VSLGRHAWLLWRHYREMGRFADSLEMLEAVATTEAAGESASAAIGVADQNLALCYLQLGQPARALRALVRTVGPPEGPAVRMGLSLARARIERWAGRDAEPHLREGLAWNLDGHRYTQAVWLSELVLGQAEGKSTDMVLALLDEQAARQSMYVAWGLRVAACHVLTNRGRHTDAANLARAMLAECATRVPTWHYAAKSWWIAARALEAAGDRAGQAEALARGKRWIQAVLPHVPEPFRDSFLHRNPFNRRLLLAVKTGAATASATRSR